MARFSRSSIKRSPPTKNSNDHLFIPQDKAIAPQPNIKLAIAPSSPHQKSDHPLIKINKQRSPLHISSTKRSPPNQISTTAIAPLHLPSQNDCPQPNQQPAIAPSSLHHKAIASTKYQQSRLRLSYMSFWKTIIGYLFSNNFYLFPLFWDETDPRDLIE